MRSTNPRLRVVALLAIAAVAALGASSAVGATATKAASSSPNNFLYQVSPFVQQVADSGSAPATFTSPFCSTKPTPVGPSSRPTLVCYGPKDLKKAYDYPSGLTGAGQTIVIVDAYGSPTVQQDLAAFDAAFSLPDVPGGLQVVCPAGCPAFNLNNRPMNEIGWAEETSLDVQWAHAMAPGAKLVLAVAPSPYGDAINSVEAKIFADPAYKGAIVSQSFGIPEYLVTGNNAQILQGHRNYALARQNGMTVLASAGDGGGTNGAGTLNAGFPASDPNVTAVGGTQGDPYFNGRGGSGGLPLPSCTSGVPCSLGLATVTCTTDVTPGPTTAATAVCPTTGYGGEKTWNEPFLPAATGGAASLLFPAPSYQGVDVTGSPMRTIPDISYNAAVSGGVLTYLGFLGPKNSGFYIFGGTSAGSPQMASVVALANQSRGSSLGFLNSTLYGLAENPVTYAADFHDITVGNNQLSGTLAGNSAHPGYDLATGWGTPNVANLVSSLAGS